MISRNGQHTALPCPTQGALSGHRHNQPQLENAVRFHRQYHRKAISRKLGTPFDLIESDGRSNHLFDAHLPRKPFYTSRDVLRPVRYGLSMAQTVFNHVPHHNDGNKAEQDVIQRADIV